MAGLTLDELDSAIRSCNQELENLRAALAKQEVQRDRAQALADQGETVIRSLLLDAEGIREEEVVDLEEFKKLRVAAGDALDNVTHYRDVAATWASAAYVNSRKIAQQTERLAEYVEQSRQWGQVLPFERGEGPARTRK